MATPIRFVAGMVCLILSICAFAQANPDDDPAEDEEAKVLEPITVTGYHIKRIDVEGPAPVLVFDREDLEQAGIVTLEEFATYLTINKPVAILDAAAGATSFNLRGIGIDTTLVLINGFRIAPYAQFAENAVDVNSIPVSAIERIEILADLVAGRDTGRGSIMFSLSWYDREPQGHWERDWSDNLDYSPIGGPTRGSTMSSPPTFLRYDTFTWEADPECGADPRSSAVGPSH
jgi:outer membrane receptor protein involved in Fe transport